MFNGKKHKCTREVISVTRNGYGEPIETYTQTGDIYMFISLLSNNLSESNNMRIQQCTHIGLTADNVAVGDRIDSRYTITFINKAGRENICYMEEVESDGIFE